MTLSPVVVLSGAHASLSAWEWQLFNAAKMQWQPGMFLPLSWQSLRFLIQLDAVFLLQTFLPPFPSPVNIHWVPTLCQHWAGPWGYNNEHYFPSGYHNMLISTFVTMPEMPTSLLCVNPLPSFYYNIAQSSFLCEALSCYFSYQFRPLHSQQTSLTFDYRWHNFHFDAE